MYLNQLGVVCALGTTTTEVWQNAVAGSQQGMQTSDLRLVDASPLIVGQVADEALPT